MTAVSREHFRQVIQLPVRWGDMDSLGHVNNARFFTYDESGRIQYFDPITEIVPNFWNEQGLILARIGCDFLAQVHYPATLEIGTRIEKIGRTSMNTCSGIFLGEKPVAEVRGVVVWFDYVNQKPTPIPQSVRAWIRGREAIAPLE